MTDKTYDPYAALQVMSYNRKLFDLDDMSVNLDELLANDGIHQLATFIVRGPRFTDEPNTKLEAFLVFKATPSPKQ